MRALRAKLIRILCITPGVYPYVAVMKSQEELADAIYESSSFAEKQYF